MFLIRLLRSQSAGADVGAKVGAEKVHVVRAQGLGGRRHGRMCVHPRCSRPLLLILYE